MDASDVGRYGTLRVLKRFGDDVVACYPIDDEEVTIGRDPNCNLRLYYDSVSSLHCKLIFRDRKAFLVVLGTNGLLVDGCAVFPAISPSSGPVIVPLPNNSIIEIHKKRFQFCYPPKELRPILLSTPSKADTDGNTPRQRKLRLSMIQSAQVFSPRPSPNPRENLRTLQTPIKTPFHDRQKRESSPLKRAAFIPESEEEENEEDILLVETNHPRVVEEDEDLVITEHVVIKHPPPQPEPPKPITPQRVAQFPLPQTAQPSPQVPQTPRRRLQPRASLHRAVLIRSAQRNAVRREIDREEEEAEEVEETINELDEEDEENGPGEAMQIDEEEQSQSTPRVSGWRKSMEVVKESLGWPFRSSPAPPDVPQNIQDSEDYHSEEPQQAMEVHEENGFVAGGEERDAEELFDPNDDIMPQENLEELMDDEDEEPFTSDAPIPAPDFGTAMPPAAPAPALGRFMTPQISRTTDKERDHGRYSVGGVSMQPRANGPRASIGPRRVKIVEPWKIEDIVVPPPGYDTEDVKAEDSTSEAFNSPRKQRLTEEEKQAIKERRRSALHMPDNFTPGSKRLLGLSPVKAPPIPALNLSFRESSVVREQPEEMEEDTEIMLARMKQMVEGVKKRQSMGTRASLSLSPKKPGAFSLLASPSGSGRPAATANISMDLEKNPFDLGVNESYPETNPFYEAFGSTDVEMEIEQQVHGESQKTQAVSSASYATPQLTGIKELFRNPKQDVAQTPRMDGMRELFRMQRPAETPAFEGVGEMLATPEAYRPAAHTEPSESTSMQGLGEESRIQTQVAAVEEPARKVAQSRLRKPGALGSRIPSTRRGGAIPRSATSRGSGQVVVVEDDDDVAEPAELPTVKVGPASRVTRKHKPRTAENDTTPAAGSSKTTDGARIADSAPEPEPGHEVEAAPEAETEDPGPLPSVPKTGRRTRKATATPPPTEVPPPTRSLRKRTPVPEATSTPSEPKSIRRGTRARPVTVEEEDELDVIPRASSPEKESGAKVRRSARSKVKQEELEDTPVPSPPEEAPEPAKPTRSRKTPATRLPAARSTGRSKPGPSSKKGAAGEPSDEPVDKENAPDLLEDDDVAPLDGRTRSTRKTTRARAGTEEREEATADAGKARVSRSKAGTRR